MNAESNLSSGAKEEGGSVALDRHTPTSTTLEGRAWMSSDSGESVSLLHQLMATNHNNSVDAAGGGSSIISSTNAAVEAASHGVVMATDQMIGNRGMDLPGLDMGNGVGIGMGMGMGTGTSMSAGLAMPSDIASTMDGSMAMSMGDPMASASVPYSVDPSIGLPMQLPLQLPLGSLPVMPNSTFQQSFPSTFQQVPASPPTAHRIAIAHLPSLSPQILPPMMHSHLRVVHRASQLGSLSFEVRQLRADGLQTLPEAQNAHEGAPSSSARKMRKAFIFSGSQISNQGAEGEGSQGGAKRKRKRSKELSMEVVQSYFAKPGAGYMIVTDPSRPTKEEVRMQEAARLFGLPISAGSSLGEQGLVRGSNEHMRETLSTFSSAQHISMLLQRCNLPPPLGAPSSGDGGSGRKAVAARGGDGGAGAGANAPGAWINRGLMVRGEGTVWTFETGQSAHDGHSHRGAMNDAASLEEWVVFVGNWGVGRDLTHGFMQAVYLGDAKVPPIDARVILNSLLPPSFIQLNSGLHATSGGQTRPNVQGPNANGLIVPVFATLSAESWAEIRAPIHRRRQESKKSTIKAAREAASSSSGMEHAAIRAAVGHDNKRGNHAVDGKSKNTLIRHTKGQPGIGDGEKIPGEVQAWAWISLIRQLGFL
ncbi:hypothetical protein IE81DRAFT_320011 [Ceraceosorus guamensis]|uniref:Uncharacterized protein n=1 Tax=Ceraceosorus guamensis TaxID=1522189 RepID=A0A316W9G5_9BASI|nr:hypothetical protein IE81DRAFT_320011 [Ceraceosorus guamensis]PWN45708.1 hypothetical protein IE81DRAFT_320011 [Ceraceosorus guamensis]